MMTDDLAAFIAARLDEDEAAAKAAASDDLKLAGRAHWATLGAIVVDAEDPDNWAVTDLTGFIDDEEVAAHIARHDPARVLREVAAKRAILALHHPEWTDYVDGDGIERSSHQCAECEPPGTPDNWPCPTIRHLAAVWDGHPSYREQWKP